jgi:hypothetical protein
MSRSGKPAVVQVMETMYCEFCGAEAGQECRSPRSGSRAAWPHSARHEAAVKQGKLPLTDEQAHAIHMGAAP